MKVDRLFIVFIANVCCLTFSCDRSSRHEAGEKVPSGTNVLMITLDTTRADRLGFYGYVKAATPTLDALAARATVFDDAHATVTLTLPSHATIMTGRYPREHGLRVNGQGRLGDQLPTLASIFKEKGYATAAFVSSFVLDTRYGLGRGFAVYDDEVEHSETGDGESTESERSADAVTERALRWLQSNGEKPFFCWIHYYDPHHPYAPPPPFRSNDRDPYDGEIAFVDQEFSKVINWLNSRSLLDRTLIIVAGDHGESFGEHGEYGHTTLLYETNLHVPLLFAHPGTCRAKHIAGPVSLVDIFPTVLDLFGLPRVDGLPGKSLASVLSGEQLEPRSCYAESEYGLRVHNWAQQRTLITSDWKFVSSTRPELFDLRKDPGEKVNLASQRSDIANSLQRELQETYAAMTPIAHGTSALSDEAVRRLEGLGYISVGGGSKPDELLTPTLPDPKDLLDVMMDLKQARKLLGEDRYGEAVPLLEKALKRSPQSMDILRLLGRAYLKTGRVDDAILTLQNALRIEPEDRSSLRTLADALMQANRREEAIRHYQMVLDIVADDSSTQFNLGTALLREKRVDEAIPHLREAVRLKPTNGEALINLGIALSKKGAFDEAQTSLKQAASIGSKASEAHYLLSQLAMLQKRDKDAESHLKKSIELEPANRKALDDLYKLYLRDRRSAEAVGVLRSAHQYEPQDTGIALTLAEILATSMHDELRNGAEAVRLAEPIVASTEGRELRALTTLAAAKAETGDFASATQNAEKALAIAESASDEKLIPYIKAQLEAYRSKRPFRNSSF